MAAETGSGKTAAFCLPVIQIVWETVKDIMSGKAAKAAVESSCKKLNFLIFQFMSLILTVYIGISQYVLIS